MTLPKISPGTLDAPCKSTAWSYVTCATAACLFIAFYLGHPALPGNSAQYPLGWWGWWDQHCYKLMAESIAAGKLTRQTYILPLGYPLLAVPFIKFWPTHPFFFLSIGLTCLCTCYTFWLLRCFLNTIESFIIALAIVFAPPEMARSIFIVPWINLPLTAVALGLAWHFVATKPTRIVIVIFAIILPLTYHIRPLEWCVFSTLAGTILTIYKRWRDLVLFLAVYSGIFIVTVGATTYVNWKVSGGYFPPYLATIDGVGFFMGCLLCKAQWMIYSCRGIVAGKQTIVANFPWLLIAAPGLLVWIRTFGRGAFAYFVAGCLVCLVYFSYNDLWPSNLIRFSNQRYFGWIIILLSAASYLSLRIAWRMLSPAVFVILFLVPAIPLALRALPNGPLTQIALSKAGPADVFFSVSFSGTVSCIQLIGPRITYRDFALLDIRSAEKKFRLFQDYYPIESLQDETLIVFGKPLSGKIDFTLPASLTSGETVIARAGDVQWRILGLEPRVSLAEYSLGNMVDFRKGTSAFPYLQSGFSVQEEGFRWSDGYVARLAFFCSSVPQEIEFQGVPYGPQNVKVFINGSFVGAQLLKDGDVTCRFRVPVTSTAANNTYVIEFRFPEAVSPESLGRSGDKRRLAFAFHSVVLR